MVKFKQFEYIMNSSTGVGQIQTVTGSKYQIVWLQLRNNFNIINPQPASMSQNYPLQPSSNPVAIEPEPLLKTEQLVQWLPIEQVDANYNSLGFDFNFIRINYLDNKGFKNEN